MKISLLLSLLACGDKTETTSQSTANATTQTTEKASSSKTASAAKKGTRSALEKTSIPAPDDVAAAPADATNDDLQALALDDDNVKRFLEGNSIRKVIVVAGKLVNIVAN